MDAKKRDLYKHPLILLFSKQACYKSKDKTSNSNYYNNTSSNFGDKTFFLFMLFFVHNNSPLKNINIDINKNNSYFISFINIYRTPIIYVLRVALTYKINNFSSARSDIKKTWVIFTPVHGGRVRWHLDEKSQTQYEKVF